jgi:hypothetical protein
LDRTQIYLKRRAAKIEPRKAIVIFCEGERTEPDYFEAYRRIHRNPLVRIEIQAAAGVPLTMVRSAVEYRRSKKRTKRDSFAKNDEVWVVFDRDEHPNVPEAIDMAEANGIKVAYSNPCFELWALLHYREHHAPDDRHQVQAHLCGCMARYDRHRRKDLDFGVMKDHTETAETRAERLVERRMQEGDPKGRPYTDVYKLTRSIREK